MNIYEHFSCHTVLPINLKTVAEHVQEQGKVTKIIRYPVAFDPPVLLGALRVFTTKPPYSTDVHKIAHILYSDKLSENDARLIIVKEMLHLLDGDPATAATQDQVAHLIDQIILPYEATVHLPVVADKARILHALCVLMPRDALDILRPAVDNGKLSVEAVADLAKIPTRWARLALSPEWENILDIIK